MYTTVLALHSLVRWFVLARLLVSIFIGYRGWSVKKPFTRISNLIRHWTATIAHIQLILGFWLYCISPIINYFLHNYREAIHDRNIRFFGMEHSLMMLTAIVIITIGSAKAKRKQTDDGKFKTMAVWFTIALLVILSSVPWAFSPLVSRPWFRAF